MPYEMIMYAGIATAAVGFVIAAVIFFQLKIPSAISDLTGRTARREIEELQHGGRMQAAEVPTTLLEPGKTGAAPEARNIRKNDGLVAEVHDVAIHTNETLAGGS